MHAGGRTVGTTLIGGNLINGGFIWQLDAKNLVTGPNLPPTFPYGSPRMIPIRECRLDERFLEKPLAGAGMLGCPTSRRVGFGAPFSFSIWFDEFNPIEAQPTEPAPTAPSFRQRDPFQLLFIAGYEPYPADYAQAYFMPRAVADSIAPIWDEQSNPRQMIGMEVTGHSRGWVFLLPDDGNPGDPTTLVGAYMAYLLSPNMGYI
jgi:hypothetical protein